MKRSQWSLVILLGSVLAVGVTGLGYVYFSQTSAAPVSAGGRSAPERAERVARVKVIPLNRGIIEETIRAYGTVVGIPGQAHIINLPFPCRVSRLLVSVGQTVKAHSPLMAIEPSLDARLQLEQARSDRNASREEVARIQEQLKLQLATRRQLLQAQQRLRHVELLLESLIRRGVGSSRMLRASSPGVVNAIYVQPGKRVPADTPLMETVDNNQVAVRLGIESQDLGRLTLGQVVRLSRVNASDERSMEGNVELITHRVNPLTRLVDVLVKPPPGARLLLHEYMRGVIVVSSRNVLLAPRAAVLPEQGRHILFTVREGRAYKHVVEVGLENDKQVQVTGPGLQTGQLVVIEGNSQIRNGMAVKMGKQP